MPKTVSDQVVDWTDLAILEFLEDRKWEDVSYDVAFQAFPDDEGRFFGQIAIYLQIPGPTNDTYVFATPILRPHGIAKQIVVDVVKQALTDMVAERDRARAGTSQT